MDQRIAVVTGVGKPTGIGFAVCQKLIEDGLSVYVTARQQIAATEIATFLQGSSGEAIPFALDITATDQIKDLRSAIEKRFGRIDILINNAAGAAPYGERAAMADLDVSRAVIDATLFGTWRLCQEFLPLLRRSQSGRIVNISSGAGSFGDNVFGLHTDNQMGTSYAVSKAALNALTVKLAREEQSTVLINAVCPGFTATFEGAENMGARPPSESAAGVIWAANLNNDGPTGGFFRDGKPLPW